MPRCFVVQPFDKGVFDKRYEDVFQPAIEAAGLEAYRVDRDPQVSVPIETIAEKIRECDICFAEITTDNPNVWFELGFSIASSKEVVLVCATEERKIRYPFDVQHRSIIEYAAESTSDFDSLKHEITERLKAQMARQRKVQEVVSTPLKATQGLAPEEVMALALMMANRLAPETQIYPHDIQRGMSNAGYSDIGTSLAVEGLLRKHLITSGTVEDLDGNQHQFYSIEAAGVDWLMNNKDELEIRTRREDDFRF